MAKSTSFDAQFLNLIFNATSISGLADNTATSPLTSLYVSLHTADPTSTGNQATNEVAYTGYARVAVARSSAGWTVSTSGSTVSVSPVANITFPAGTDGSGTATNWAVGTAASGAGEILYTGTISPNIVCGNGVTPILTTGSTITEQ